MTNEITPDALEKARESTAPPLIVDVRSAADYAAGHIPGAENLPAEEIERSPEQIPKDRPIVVY